jgi:citrate synthase
VNDTLARGLKDVVLDTTESSYIDGELGVLLYRGYSIHDLAANSSFEEVTYLLLHGALPTEEELSSFKKRLKGQRGLPKGVIDVIRLVQKAHPMDVLRTAVSALAAFDPDTEDMSREASPSASPPSSRPSSPHTSASVTASNPWSREMTSNTPPTGCT